MHTGQVVLYTAADGASDGAIILGVTGVGPSGMKVLDLAVRGSRVADVAHADDIVGLSPRPCSWSLLALAVPDVSHAVIEQQIEPTLVDTAPPVAAPVADPVAAVDVVPGVVAPSAGSDVSETNTVMSNTTSASDTASATAPAAADTSSASSNTH